MNQQRNSSQDPSVSADQRADDRIGVVDALRGLALLGMFVVHFIDNFSQPPTSAVERGIQQFSRLFLSDRFHTMFAILFGVGFAIQLRRADARGQPIVARYLRRMAALAGFGIVAEIVFGFQILFGYAVWGLVLLPVRRWPSWALLVLALVCGAARPIYSVARAAYYTPAISAQDLVTRDQAAEAAQRSAPMFKALRSTDWRAAFSARTQRMRGYYATPILPPSDLLYFLIGVLALRLGLLEQPNRHKGLLVGLIVFGVWSWALKMWVLPGFRPGPLPGLGEWYAPTVARDWLRSGFGLIRVQWLTLTYMGGILLLVARNASALHRLAPLAWAGRMALTNYMLQIMVLGTLFWPYALGLHSPLWAAPLCGVGLFAIQALLSRWWLRQYRFGPLEWVWRCITYWRVEPIRRTRSLASDNYVVLGREGAG